MEQHLSQRVKSMSESATIRMAQLARELKSKGHDVISLSLGEPDFDTPQFIKEAAKKALDEGFTKYTPVPGIQELREAISQKLKRDNGVDFSASQIMVSNGAKQCIYNLAMSLCDPGDEVIIFTPYWVSYADIVTLAEGVPVFVEGTIENDFKINPEQLKKAITDKTKAVLFSSPCNPTGTVYEEEDLKAIAKILADYPGITILSDEIYEYINFSGNHVSIASFPEVKEQTVIINGFSKGYSMTGWRLGYMAGPQALVNACSKIQGQCTSGANAFGQKAAVDAILGDQKPTQDMKEAFEKRKQLVLSLLDEIPGVKRNNPKGAFYVFPDVSSFYGKSYNGETINDSDDFAAFILQEAHVGVVGGGAFGADNCIRISYAASEAELTEALKRIKNAVAKLQ